MEEVFLDHLDLIRRVGSSAVRRAGFPPQDAEDFVSRVQLKLVEDDYAVLRKHRGDSSLSTFLVVVVNNQFKDFCNHKLGKYRPSARAKQLGPNALALERLLVRDGHELESAIEILRSQLDVSADELRKIADQLPQRTPRRFVNDEVLDQQNLGPPGSTAERVQDGERAATAERVEAVLNLALKALDVQDLLILKMHFRDGCSFTEIASALRLDQRSLYTRKDKSLRKLHAMLEDEGLTWDAVREILGWQGLEMRADFRTASEDSETVRGDRDDESENHDGESV